MLSSGGIGQPHYKLSADVSVNVPVIVTRPVYWTKHLGSASNQLASFGDDQWVVTGGARVGG